VVGSTNLDFRSIEFNLEIGAIVRSRDFASQMSGLFEHDTHFARAIRHDEWRKRPMRDRFVQWTVSRLRYLL
jgi:phosphatidylserine/phosphatidylglycerophosphate/cardiolipin synthase-like enzyme